MDTEYAHVYFPYAYRPQSRKGVGKKATDCFNITQRINIAITCFNTGTIKPLYSKLSILLFRQDVQQLHLNQASCRQPLPGSHLLSILEGAEIDLNSLTLDVVERIYL